MQSNKTNWKFNIALWLSYKSGNKTISDESDSAATTNHRNLINELKIIIVELHHK